MNTVFITYVEPHRGIEEPDTEIEKKLAKPKSCFPTFLGSAVLAGAVALFF
jgi:hypothetical protein